MLEMSSAVISDSWNSIQKIKFCVSQDDRNLTDELHQNFSYSKAEFLSIVEDLVSDRTPRGLCEGLFNVKSSCKSMTEYMEVMENKFREFVDKYTKKTMLIRILLEDGMEYLGDSSLDKYLKNNDMNVFMLFISEGFETKKIFRNINYLYNLMIDCRKKSIFLIIDLDVSIVRNKIKIPKDSVIYHYKDTLISEDVQSDMDKKTDVGYVYFSPRMETTKQPEKRCVLNIKCPGSFLKMCGGRLIDWKCAKCGELIEYGFDNKFYCECGNYQIETSKFKCSDYRHNDPVEFKNLNDFYDAASDLTPFEEINILLVGQTGVGKSTWINGIVNYLTFSSLEEAEKSDLIAVVPTQFAITTEDYETHTISVGEDPNEVKKVGASATQDCKSYAFVTRNGIVRLIDTPGIGDVRGYEQDAENMVKIIQHIQNVKKLHGICFLLKPDEARLEACFKFCMKEIFSFLSKKARSNILFCFTNSRKTFYDPKTLPLIEKLLEDANSKIHVFQDTRYCFDNESFRFLCAIKNGIKFSDEEKKSYADSWKRSVEETYKLVVKVAGLHPYDVSETKNIADLRHKISTAIDAIHDITKNSETGTIKSIESEIRDCYKKIVDLRNSKSVRQTTLRTDTLIRGDIVCTNASCTEKFGNQTVHKSRCCEGCRHLSPTKYETLSNVELLKCPTLARLNCTACGCRWEQHMITGTKHVKETRTKIDDGVLEEIKKTKKRIINLHLQIERIRGEVGEEETKKQDFTKFASNVFRCLKKDTLILYNDGLKDYLDYLITDEESKPDKTGDERMKIKRLNELKNKHEEESKIAEEVKKESFPSKDPVPKITIQNIIDEEVTLELKNRYRKKANKYEEKVISSERVIRCLK